MGRIEWFVIRVVGAFFVAVVFAALIAEISPGGISTETLSPLETVLMLFIGGGAILVFGYLMWFFDYI